jgi:hypothetical protein
MQGLNVGLVIGAIFNNKNKNKVGQPGGCLIYVGIPFVGFALAVNALAWNLDAETPHLPWLSPSLIMFTAIFLTAMIAWIRKVDRETKKKEEEARHKRWLESFGGKVYSQNR